ncbi:hypothetical protein [Streptomyces pseudovenezuelae]|uniref:Peptidoglycan binding-like domain-containing protein n=1 Tax=Streptomyces pseudovenezuelae TaxID=67350 RepID=A0ABT6LKI9_9ACTN|nr:hypothetical protein [Streptomyces pseudovenezuelae]MDH6216490.1 hypothetical protein [Streptomyces pseudovenezuelae]
MNSSGMRSAGLGLAVVAALVMGAVGCRPTPTKAAGTTTAPVRNMAAAAGTGTGGACVFVKPDGAQKLGHVGWGFRVTGTDQWVYGAVENPTDKLYTPPGGDIGAWHAQGTYARMLSEMSRDAHYPGRSTHPYSRYRCTSSSTSDVGAARAMIRTVESRGFLVGVDPRTGALTSRDCLDATYDVLRAYRTRHLTPAPKLYVPNVWVETLVLWSDRTL